MVGFNQYGEILCSQKSDSVCANGYVEEGEECDDGNIFNGDGCSAQCGDEICGNGTLNYDEECDDGNLVDSDGCSSICQSEQIDPEPLELQGITQVT